ncbi:MAG: hypothetical protein CMB80_01955 [Flammeovirgaceae bacterium]|jgi:hypothetical protein|nr:hypothetical protein [Flammeovirgaceae bacterium]|tara:strand:+ start:1416 stop:1868 length:453 start_codon:yes stop_codon:yes gene_type:complete
MYIATFNSSGGNLVSYTNTELSITELQVKKRNYYPNAVCFEITQTQHGQLKDGWEGSESGGVVTVTEPAGWLNGYKAEAKEKEKKKGVRLFKKYRDDIANSDANISTYKSNLKAYFISDVKNPIELRATNTKQKVDDIIKLVDWSSVVIS